MYIKKSEIPIQYPSLSAVDFYHNYIPKKGDVIFDVGGELGIETKQFALLAGRHGIVHVFECLPEHIERLKDLQKDSPQIILHNIACWYSEGFLEFHVGHTPGSGSAVPNAKGQQGQDLANLESRPLQVVAKTLDSIWIESGWPSVDFLKMDIEGAEYEALEGASLLLKNTQNAAIAAYHIRDGVPTANNFSLILKAAGFKTRIDKNLHGYGWR